MTRQELQRIGILLNCKATGKPGVCKLQQAVDKAHGAMTAKGAETKKGYLKRHKLSLKAAEAHSQAAKKTTDKSTRQYHENESLMFEQSARKSLDKHYATK